MSEQVYDYLKQNYPEDCLQWVKSAKWKKEEDIPLKDIQMARRPGGPRERDKVEGIAKAIKSGEPMEAIVLVKTPDGKFKIADGYHRTLGYQHAGKKTVEKAWVGEVSESSGPWDKEMHEKKLNIGKKAFDEFLEYLGFEKEALDEIPLGALSSHLGQLDDVAGLALMAQRNQQQAQNGGNQDDLNVSADKDTLHQLHQHLQTKQEG